jgi:biotin operon repressor
MPLTVNPEAAARKSRVALIQLLDLNLRLMEAWRRAQTQLFGAALDCESTMILMAIIAIGAEKLVRTGNLKDFEDLSVGMDVRLLRKCNLSSIAATTGLNREMVRRRVGTLEKKGLVVREPNGGVRIADGILQLPEVRESVNKQLDSIATTVGRLRKAGLLEPAPA